VLPRSPRLREAEEALLGEGDGGEGRVEGRVLLSGTEGETERREEDVDVGRVEEVVKSL